MSDHLTPERIEALLAGRLPADLEADLATHLAAGDCDACEQVLAALDPEVAQRLVDVLVRIERAGAKPPPAVRAAVLETLARRAWWRKPWAWGAGLAAAAAAALVLVVAWWGPADPDPGGQRVKGHLSAAGAIELTAGVVQHRPGDPTRVRPIRQDEDLAPGQTLVFRIRTAAAGCHPYLLHRIGDRLEVLWPATLSSQRPLPAGDHPLQQAGKPLGLSLEAHPGDQAFWAVCSLEAIEDPARLRALIPAGPTDLPPQPPEGVSWDRVRVKVPGPGEAP